MQKNSFVLPTRLNDVVAKLSDKQAGVLFKGILNYATNGTVANFEDGAVIIAFTFVKQDMDYTAKKYVDTCNRRAENGRLGGLAKVANASKSKQMLANASKAKHNDYEYEYDNDDDNTKKENLVKEKTLSKFIKPTVEQVSAYCQSRNNGIDAQQFVDFYESKGWKVGNSPMKDWQAAVRNWERRNKQEGVKRNEGTDYNREPELGKYAGFGREIRNED